VATVLFEAGHYQNDYNREETRKLIAISILKALSLIGSSDFSENDYSSYSAIPENGKLFFDILLKNVAVLENEHKINIDVGVRYEEALEDGKILFTPKLISKGDLSAYFGHRTIDLQSRSLDSSAEARELLGIGFCDIFTKRH
jgi:UDP-galactopyranose mutase